MNADADGLDGAIELFEAALAGTVAGSPDHPAMLNDLATALARRYLAREVAGDRDRAIELREAAVAATAPDSPDRPVRLGYLGGALLKRYEAHRAAGDLDRAIELLEAAVAAVAPTNPDRPAILNNFGDALMLRYEARGAAGDLDRAITLLEAAVATAAPTNPDRPAMLNDVGKALILRYEARGAAGDFDRAIKLLEAAVATAVGSPLRPRLLDNLGSALTARGAASDLDRAIELREAALAATAVGSPLRSRLLDNLGGALTARGAASDLDRAIELREAALAATAPDSPDRPVRLGYLGNALVLRYNRRYEKRRAASDLDRAIELLEAALAAGSPEGPGLLGNLGNALTMRYEAGGAASDLDRAIELLEPALAATAAGSPGRPRLLDNLGNALTQRYQARGMAGDLDRAIELLETALAAAPTNPDRPAMLNNLGGALTQRYEAGGAVGDLDRGIEVLEAALAAGSPEGPGLLGNLGNALTMRYEAGGAASDLDRAIELLEPALAATAAGSPGRPGLLDNLGNALTQRYEARGMAGDLDRAIELLEAALASTAAGSPQRLAPVLNLGIALERRYKARGAADDLDREVEILEATLATAARDNPARPSVLNNLGGALIMRYYAQRAVRDLDRAIELLRLALLLLPDGSTRSTSIRKNLATGLRLATELYNPTQLALTGIARAADAATQRQPERSGLVSIFYANRAFQGGDWANSARLYDPAFRARAVAFGLKYEGQTSNEHENLVDERLEWQRIYAGAGARAAYALLHARSEGALDRAVLALENGLQQGVQEAFGLIEIDLERYHEAGYFGAERFRHARRELARLIFADERGGEGAPSLDKLTAARREYDLALDDIRAKPGFGDFLQPVEIATVRRAAAVAPLIYFGATSHGGLAVLVPDETSPIEAIELPDLTTEAAAEVVREFEEAREALSRGEVDADLLWAARLDQVLRSLWFHGMGELTDLIESREIAQALLIPYGGSPAQLPWHAAWTPDSRRPEGRRYACNRVVWRYAPGVKLLGEKRVWQPRRGKASETLVVRHTGANSPKLAEQEAQAIRTHMGPITELAETVITAPSVLKAWAKARYVHLATHGRSDPTDPMKTHLVLSDDNRLTVSDLLRARQPLAARLVTLAACEAAVTSGRQGIDEIVGFPAALLRAESGRCWRRSGQ